MEKSTLKPELKTNTRLEPKLDNSAKLEYYCKYHKQNYSHNTADCFKIKATKEKSLEPKWSVNFIKLILNSESYSHNIPLTDSIKSLPLHELSLPMSHTSLPESSLLKSSLLDLHTSLLYTCTDFSVDVNLPNHQVEWLISTGCTFPQMCSCESPETLWYVVPQPHKPSIVMRGHTNLHKDMSPCKIPYRALSVISRSFPRMQTGVLFQN